jgi:hypothetical protein
MARSLFFSLAFFAPFVDERVSKYRAFCDPMGNFHGKATTEQPYGKAFGFTFCTDPMFGPPMLLPANASHPQQHLLF